MTKNNLNNSNAMETKTYTKEELVRFVDHLGHNSGGEIEVTGLNGGEDFSIMIAQTEWHDSPVCLVGGYGGTVVVIDRDDVETRLAAILDDFFDNDSIFTILER